MKLSKRKIKQIEVWLGKKDRDRECPFNPGEGCGIESLAEKICIKAFPKVVDNTSYYCPCYSYTLRWVTQKAKQMVKTGEV